MNAFELINRKFHQGWTDAEAMVLLIIADRKQATLTQVNEACGLPASSGHHAINSLLTRNLLQSDYQDGKRLYRLTKDGQETILIFLAIKTNVIKPH